MRLINAEPILQRMAEEEVSGKELRRMLRESDQIDLIRCSECKHVRRYVIGSKQHWCAIHDTITHLGDFCSWAERDA